MKTEKFILSETDCIEIPIPETLNDCITLIKSDLFRYIGKMKNIFICFLYTFRIPGFACSFYYRFSQIQSFFFPICKIMNFLLSHKYGIALPKELKCGYGLYIGHGFGTLVNSTAVIGNYVNLSQFTTIGSNKNNAAIIGDNVYIGPNVCVVENVKIGSNSTIGAGSVVVKYDVPKNAVVAGNPAKVIHENKPRINHNSVNASIIK